jgi:hypothetical protein
VSPSDREFEDEELEGSFDDKFSHNSFDSDARKVDSHLDIRTNKSYLARHQVYMVRINQEADGEDHDEDEEELTDIDSNGNP